MIMSAEVYLTAFPCDTVKKFVSLLQVIGFREVYRERSASGARKSIERCPELTSPTVAQ